MRVALKSHRKYNDDTYRICVSENSHRHCSRSGGWEVVMF